MKQGPRAPSIVAGLIDKYISDASQSIDAICRASESSDTDALARAAHMLRIGSDFLGARKLAEMCGELEQVGLAGELQDIGQKIDRIQQEYEAVQTAMATVRSGP